MPFKKILVPVDGSSYSQLAVEYAIWLSKCLKATVTAQHVIDPRFLDLILAPEFAQSLGFGTSVDASEKVYQAMNMIGATILDLVKQEFQNNKTLKTELDVGWIVEQILQRAKSHDLIIVGHHSRGSEKAMTSGMIGSVAERVVVLSKKPVLVAAASVIGIKEIVVAFDGSEPSRGALLLGNALAQQTRKPLRAVVAAQSRTKAHQAAAHLTTEQGAMLLQKVKGKAVFETLTGAPASTILKYARKNGGLLVLGAYGYRSPESNVLGSTTTSVIRNAETSVLIYR